MNDKATTVVIESTGEVREMATVSQTPTDLIAMAINQNADVDKLEKLMQLQERWEANQARKTFFAALSLFQSSVPRVTKRKEGHNYKYAPLDDIVEQIRPSLYKCGLTYRYEQSETKSDDGMSVGVSCIVTHIDGHSESTSMNSVVIEGTKMMSGVQKQAATVTYLRRYTLTAALGLVTADEDIDGRITVPITEDQIAELRKQIAIAGMSEKELCARVRSDSIQEIDAARYDSISDWLEGKAVKGDAK